LESKPLDLEVKYLESKPLDLEVFNFKVNNPNFFGLNSNKYPLTLSLGVQTFRFGSQVGQVRFFGAAKKRNPTKICFNR